MIIEKSKKIYINLNLTNMEQSCKVCGGRHTTGACTEKNSGQGETPFKRLSEFRKHHDSMMNLGEALGVAGELESLLEIAKQHPDSEFAERYNIFLGNALLNRSPGQLKNFMIAEWPLLKESASKLGKILPEIDVSGLDRLAREQRRQEAQTG